MVFEVVLSSEIAEAFENEMAVFAIAAVSAVAAASAIAAEFEIALSVVTVHA